MCTRYDTNTMYLDCILFFTYINNIEAKKHVALL